MTLLRRIKMMIVMTLKLEDFQKTIILKMEMSAMSFKIRELCWHSLFSQHLSLSSFHNCFKIFRQFLLPYYHLWRSKIMINNRMRTTYILTSQLLTIDIRNILKPYNKIKLMLNIKNAAENDNDENEITKSNRSLVPDSSTGSDEDVIYQEILRLPSI